MWQYNETINSDELYHYGVIGMKWGRKKGNNSTVSKNRTKAMKEFEAHIKKNNGYIKNVKRYQEMPITKMTKNKRYSDYYTFDRKRKTIVAKKIVNDLGGTKIKNITEKDYKRGEQLVNKLTDDWVNNIRLFSNNLLNPIEDS